MVCTNHKPGQNERGRREHGSGGEKRPRAADLPSWVRGKARGDRPGKAKTERGARRGEEQPAGGDEREIHAARKTGAMQKGGGEGLRQSATP